MVLIACSTALNWTSCWVNWFASIGASGSWCWSWVVSSCRKLLKSSARPSWLLLVPEAAPVPAAPEAPVAAAPEAATGLEAVTSMA